jgi:hypothetical protein
MPLSWSGVRLFCGDRRHGFDLAALCFYSAEKAVFKLAQSFAWSNPVLTEEYISNSV